MKVLRKIKQKVNQKYKALKQKKSDTYYFSIGENCLTDNVLERFGLKSFSTPYSHGRSNLDYAIDLEKNSYADLLKPEYLYYDEVANAKVVRNKIYANGDDMYNEYHNNGFEFTHHDVIGNEDQRKSYERKIARMIALDNQKKLKFFYHYRSNENRDLDAIERKAAEFLSYYQKRNIECEFIFFTQDIVSSESERELIQIVNKETIKGFLLKTLETWKGNDDDVFWARKDNDLLGQMIKQVK